MKEKYGFVYIWRDSAKSKVEKDEKKVRYYIGRHWGTEDDGYVCSSNWMRRSILRRPSDFQLNGKPHRRILFRTNNKNELREKEGQWLSLIKDEELGKKYYNLNKNFISGVLGHSQKTIENIKKSLPNRSGENHPMFGRTHKPSSIEKMKKPKAKTGKVSESLRNQWASGKRKGHAISEEQSKEHSIKLKEGFASGRIKSHNKGKGKSGYPYVFKKDKRKKPWYGRIGEKGKYIFFMSYSTPEEANKHVQKYLNEKGLNNEYSVLF